MVVYFKGLNGSGAKITRPTTITEKIKASFNFNSFEFIINNKNSETQIN